MPQEQGAFFKKKAKKCCSNADYFLTLGREDTTQANHLHKALCTTKTTKTMTDERLVVIKSYNTVTEAEIARSILSSGGIESTIRNEYSSTLYPTGIIPAQVVIRAEDEAAARELLNVR